MLIFGQNEAESRLMKELHETNPEGTQYPKATNNRGSEGGHYLNPSETGDKALKQHGMGKKREAHAHGDRVGRMKHDAGDEVVGEKAQPGEMKQHAMKRGGHRHAEGGHEERRNKKHGGRDCYSAGEEVVPLKHEQPGGGYKRGGRMHHEHDEHSEMKRGGRR